MTTYVVDGTDYIESNKIFVEILIEAGVPIDVIILEYANKNCEVGFSRKMINIDSGLDVNYTFTKRLLKFEELYVVSRGSGTVGNSSIYNITELGKNSLKSWKDAHELDSKLLEACF